MTLLYFAPVPWDSYFQRPHYFVRHFLSEAGRTAIWIDPYPTRLPVWRDLARAAAASATTPRPAGLTVLRFGALPIEPLPGGQWLNRHVLGRALRAAIGPHTRGAVAIAIGRPSALALSALDTVPHQSSVYDAMDDFPEFYRGLSRRSTRDLELAIARRVDVVLVSSQALWAKFGGIASRRAMVPNAFDMSSLPAVTREWNGHQVLGYVGCVADWFDWDAVRRLASAMPRATIEIIGPRAWTPRGLPSNVTLWPACSHDEAILRMRRFAVGLIPFKQSRLTAAVDPIKYYAYRGLGLPVLSTRFGEMDRRGAADRTFFLDDERDAAAAASAALASRPERSEIERFRAAHDWQQRFHDAGLFGGLAR